MSEEGNGIRSKAGKERCLSSGRMAVMKTFCGCCSTKSGALAILGLNLVSAAPPRMELSLFGLNQVSFAILFYLGLKLVSYAAPPRVEFYLSLVSTWLLAAPPRAEL